MQQQRKLTASNVVQWVAVRLTGHPRNTSWNDVRENMKTIGLFQEDSQIQKKHRNKVNGKLPTRVEMFNAGSPGQWWLCVCVQYEQWRQVLKLSRTWREADCLRRSSSMYSTARWCSSCFILLFWAFICSIRSSSANLAKTCASKPLLALHEVSHWEPRPMWGHSDKQKLKVVVNYRQQQQQQQQQHTTIILRPDTSRSHCWHPCRLDSA